jgi:hypothetical protein
MQLATLHTSSQPPLHLLPPMHSNVSAATHATTSSHQFFEVIDSKTLAERWALPVSWIREGVRSRATDPIPHQKFGKYVRFRWGSPELEAWMERRLVCSTPSKSSRSSRKETIQ